MNALCGLVMAGGRSRRMGRPKETLIYRDVPEPQRIYRMLEDLTDGAYYSVREDQAGALQFAGGRLIIDSEKEGGPLAALMNAFYARPDTSWLVVPVDMPLLEIADLRFLISARETRRELVAYRDEAGSFEPMPAIYEYPLVAAAETMLKNGRRAIRGLGDGIVPKLIIPEDRKRLSNVNTHGERNQVMKSLRH